LAALKSPQVTEMGLHQDARVTEVAMCQETDSILTSKAHAAIRSE